MYKIKKNFNLLSKLGLNFSLARNVYCVLFTIYDFVLFQNNGIICLIPKRIEMSIMRELLLAHHLPKLGFCSFRDPLNVVLGTIYNISILYTIYIYIDTT